MPGVKKMIVVLMAVVVASSCSQKRPKPNSAEPPSYRIPEPSPIAKSELSGMRAGAEQFYDTMLRPGAFNGGMILSVKGNIAFERYRGVDAKTALHIASTSKTFTAAVILKLNAAGKLSLTDPLTKFFPEFNYQGVRIIDLLNHRSGLPNYIYFLPETGWPDSAFISNYGVLHELISKKDQIKDIRVPDKAFYYCNTNYVLLALVIEKVTGMSYAYYMKKFVFEPLGMNQTFVRSRPEQKVTGSYGRKGREIPDMNLDFVYGDKNIYSTPRDILRWERALSNYVFLDSASLAAAYKGYSYEHKGIHNYGLGWRLFEFDDGRKIVYHNGWWHGSRTAFIRLLRNDAAIIVITNHDAKNVYKSKMLANLFEPYFNYDDPEDDAASSEKKVAEKDTRNDTNQIGKKH